MICKNKYIVPQCPELDVLAPESVPLLHGDVVVDFGLAGKPEVVFEFVWRDREAAPLPGLRKTQTG
jgi:hypothetical protein